MKMKNGDDILNSTLVVRLCSTIVLIAYAHGATATHAAQLLGLKGLKL